MLAVLLQQIINGLVLASIYCLVAEGTSLIYGVMKLFNFAHGEFFMLGAYASFFIFSLLNINPYLSLIIASVIVFLLGVTTARSLIVPLMNRQGWERGMILITFGLSITIQNLALLIWGPNYRGEPSYFTGMINFFGLVITFERLVIAIVAFSALIIFMFFLRKTQMGKAIRAVAENKDAAAIMGIPTKQVYLLTFGISVALAAFAGGLLLPLTGVYPLVGGTVTMKGFAVVLLGGLGNPGGAIIGGFILGLTETFAMGYISSAFRDAIAYGMIISILLIKPAGLFGKKYEN